MYTKIVEYKYKKEHSSIVLKDSIPYRCRFCGRVKTKKDFRKKAHAVSEGIGNKNIITSYECDECNQRFANCEENELGNLFRLYKAVRAKKTKKGITKIHGAEFKYTEDKTLSAKIDMSDKSLDIFFEKAPNGTLAPTFAVKQKINFKLIYRAFMKFALSVIPEEISLELEDEYIMFREKKEYPDYKGIVVVFEQEIEDPGIAIYKINKDSQYFCSIDIYQMRFVIPINFGNSRASDLLDLIGNLEELCNKRNNIFPIDYSNKNRKMIQKEQPYHCLK